MSKCPCSGWAVCKGQSSSLLLFLGFLVTLPACKTKREPLVLVSKAPAEVWKGAGHHRGQGTMYQHCSKHQSCTKWPSGYTFSPSFSDAPEQVLQPAKRASRMGWRADKRWSSTQENRPRCFPWWKKSTSPCTMEHALQQMQPLTTRFVLSKEIKTVFIILMVAVQNHSHYLQFLYHLNKHLQRLPPVNPHLHSRVTHPSDTHPQPQRLWRCCSLHSRALGQGSEHQSYKLSKNRQHYSNHPRQTKKQKIPSLPTSPCRQSLLALTWTLLIKLGEAAAFWACLWALWDMIWPIHCFL